MRNLLFLVFIVAACTKPTVDRVALNRYADDRRQSKLYATVEAEGYAFTLRYQPASLLAANSLDEVYSDAEYKAALGAFCGAEHFVLTVSRVQGETRRYLQDRYGAKYDSVYNRLLFDYATHLSLRCGSRTYPCSICHLENDGNARNGYTFVLGFETAEKVTGDRTVVLHDGAFASTDVSLTVSADAIERIPTLTPKNKHA